MKAFYGTKPHKIALSELKKNPVHIQAYQIIFAKESYWF